MDDIFPNSIDIELASQKGLATNRKLIDKYFKIQNIYKCYFEKYILNILNLKEYDDKISSNDLKISYCPEYKQDYYQKNSTLGLKYIYIKNNLHIEKLELTDLAVLEQNSDGKQIEDIVLRTYPDVITISTLNLKKITGNFKTQFFEGFDTHSTVFDNNSLIIIIREGKLKTGLSGQHLIDYVNKKHKFMKDIINEMEENFKGKLKCNVEIGHLLH